MKITEAAGVAQGTFYLYFASKKDDLRRARPRPEPARPPRDEGGLGAGRRPDRAGAARLPRLLPLHRRAPGALPDHPAGRVRLARRRCSYHYEKISEGYVDGAARRDGAGEVAEGDPEVLAWALMATGELLGMRWMLWNGKREMPAAVLAELDRLIARMLEPPVSRVGVAATATYLPERWLTAAEIGAASGIPEQVLVEKFGLRGKHVAADDEHVEDMAVRAACALLDERGIDPDSIDCVLYFGSTWKDYAVWQAAPWIAHRLGCSRAFGLEYDNVSMGSPMALRVAKALLVAEPELSTVLLVAACRESHLLDYGNERARFMFNFGDGAVAALLARTRRTSCSPRTR